MIHPIAGPEELKQEEIDELPIDLQYLPLDKTREPSAEIRKLILEALLQLCSTKAIREVIRDSNVYYLLREYHLWEQDEEALAMLENVIDILIKKEEEINVDNLKKLDIPSDLVEKFEKLWHFIQHNFVKLVYNQNIYLQLNIDRKMCTRFNKKSEKLTMFHDGMQSLLNIIASSVVP